MPNLRQSISTTHAAVWVYGWSGHGERPAGSATLPDHHVHAEQATRALHGAMQRRGQPVDRTSLLHDHERRWLRLGHLPSIGWDHAGQTNAVTANALRPEELQALLNGTEPGQKSTTRGIQQQVDEPIVDINR